MMDFHILGQCKSLLSTNELLGYDIGKLRAMEKPDLLKAMANIEKVMLTTRDKALAYSAAMLLDAGLGVNIHDIVCERSLPIHHRTILSFIFETSLGNEKDPYRHLLFKCWPLRCWTRKFVEVTASYFELDSGIEAFVNHAVLCMLLGNYEHNTVRPPLLVRRRLYELLDYRHRATYQAPQAVQFRERLLGETKRVYLHALQEFICNDISSDPALVRQVQHMMPFEEFRTVVVATNDKFREIVSTYTGSDDDTLMQKLSTVVESVREDILEVSYEKPVPPFIEYLKDLKSYAKPSARLWFKRYYGDNPKMELVEKSRAGYVKPSTEIAQGIQDVAARQQKQKKKKTKRKQKTPRKKDDDDDEPEDMELEDQHKDKEVPSLSDYDPKAIDAQINEFFDERKQEEARLKELEEEAAMRDDIQKIRVTAMQITVEHSYWLAELFTRFDPRTTPSDEILRTVLRCFPAFGCTEYAADDVRKMMIDYTVFKKAKEDWKRMMADFNNKHPYAGCLLQAVRRFIVGLRQVQSSALPRNVIAAQLRSIQSKHNTADPERVPEECIYLYACQCCRDVKTLLQAFKNNHKQNYTEGRREVLTDLRTGLPYCKKNDVFAHMQCSDQPLMKLLGIGTLILFRKRVIVFCCQPGCGARAMHVDPEHTTFNEHYIACAHCTLEIMKVQRAEYEAQYDPLYRNTNKETHCFACDKMLSTKQPYYLMAKGTFICHRHKTQPMALVEYIGEHVSAAVRRVAFSDDNAAKEIREAIVKCRAAIKATWAGVNAKRNDTLLRRIQNARVAARGGHS